MGRRYKKRQLHIRAGIGLAVTLLVGMMVFTAVRPRPGIAYPDLGNQHILPPAKVTYNSYPPTSGPHYSSIAAWGIHDTPIPNELQVHNLEDGGVMVQYNCDGDCTDLVLQLTDIVERFDDQVILAPYYDMTHKIALTAWNRLETLDAFDEDQIVKFIKAYRALDHHQ